MDFAQTPYAVKIDASLPGIKCYLCCGLLYMHIDGAFPLLSSPFVSLLLHLYLSLRPLLSSRTLLFSAGKESAAVKSTFVKLLLLFGSNGHIIYKVLLSCSVVNISFSPYFS